MSSNKDEPPTRTHQELLELIRNERPELLNKLTNPQNGDYFYSRSTGATWVWFKDHWENNAYWTLTA